MKEFSDTGSTPSQRRGYKSNTIFAERGRSLAWIRHQPAELGIPSSNLGGPAISISSTFF